jgi:hypothetical protein
LTSVKVSKAASTAVYLGGRALVVALMVALVEVVGRGVTMRIGAVRTGALLYSPGEEEEIEGPEEEEEEKEEEEEVEEGSMTAAALTMLLARQFDKLWKHRGQSLEHSRHTCACDGDTQSDNAVHEVYTAVITLRDAVVVTRLVMLR